MTYFVKRLTCLLLLLSASVPVLARAVESSTPRSTRQEATGKEGVGQEHNFEDLLVQGKYHFSDEAVTTVEEDKVLDSLLGVRTEFKDRLEATAGRH